MTTTPLAIDVSAHRDSRGKLYMPSRPWGIHNLADMPDEPGRLIGSGDAPTKVAAMEQAVRWCDRIQHSAIVFRRDSGKVAATYAHDGTNLHFTLY